ncbi:DMT family transporter [Marivita hallyeonensis]|uniref:Permease of the drug/metabolite transporter (DMT) superfamily n=1 Tax=Marivita hallyeonensis TaxID=996342 RepID=A0A1M5UJV8_9RHOB|nr:DMT family transporter [Marivita hallyeonensis]SHH63324.1 Permease of the drug/metabolite transporter (DMT) superfamily [Marivita hallyeonensis]
MSSNAKGALLALIAFGLYSTHDVFIKTLGAIYSPIQIVFFSVLLSFPLATVMLMRDAKPGTLLPVHPWWMAVRTAAAVITGVSAFYAFANLPLTQTYAILFATPLLITVLSIPILGETVRIMRWAAVIVGLAGVLVVLRPGTTELTLGHAAAIVAAVAGSFASIVVRKIGAEERTVVMLLYPMVANFAVMGAALGFVYKPMPIEHLGMLALISVIAWIGARFIIAAYQTGEAAIVAPMQYSQILWATVYGLFFFDEVPDLYTGVGAAIIIASGVFIVFRESKAGTSKNTPVLRTRSRVGTPAAARVSDLMTSGRVRDALPSSVEE